MKTNYCEGWFRADKCITEQWTEEQARKAHNSRQMYTAVLGGLKSPYCFVEMRDSSIGTGFLDDNLREYMTYIFDEYEPGKLFLTHVYFRYYDGESDTVIKVETYVFFRDGRTVITDKDVINKTVSKSESTKDLSGNYNDYPEFGDYRVLTRKERE